MSQIKANDNAYIAHTYGRFDIVLTHGSGALLYDENEKEYIDMTAGIGVNCLGFGNEEWVRAVACNMYLTYITQNLIHRSQKNCVI